jgi:putative DNA primase/helicase
MLRFVHVRHTRPTDNVMRTRPADIMQLVWLRPKLTEVGSNGLRPGDDFNARATWAEILEPFGWKLLERRGNQCVWQRSGFAPAAAVSGCDDADSLRLWFASGPGSSYSKFHMYALLNHGGDYAEAARALRAAGYASAVPA